MLLNYLTGVLGGGIRNHCVYINPLPLQCGDPLKSSESDVCRRQILTTKVDPPTVRVKIFLMPVDPYNIGIQMNQKELTKTYMMISN